MMGPLGNGFPLDIPEKNAILVGGGIGVPPLLELAKQLSEPPHVVLGYRDTPFLKEEFEKTGAILHIATEDGSEGTKGTIIGALPETAFNADVIYACGPRAMLKSVRLLSHTRHIRCYLSMEERMACGVGACLGCICRTRKENDKTGVKNVRVCTEGPVFLAEEVIL